MSRPPISSGSGAGWIQRPNDLKPQPRVRDVAGAQRDASGEPELRYREWAPEPDLAPWVLCYWEFTALPEAVPRPHNVMPDGCVSIVCAGRDDAMSLGLVGPGTRALQTVIQPGQVVRGLRFWPYGAVGLLGVDPSRLRNAHLPLADVLRDLDQSVRAFLGHGAQRADVAAAFAAALRERLPGALPVDTAVRAAVEALTLTNGVLAINELARRVGLSERQLQRRFGAAVGVTPKQFARIRRLRSTMGLALHPGNGGWSGLAAQLGFADQAHMIREFSALTGQSPEAFLSHTRRIEHVDVRP